MNTIVIPLLSVELFVFQLFRRICYFQGITLQDTSSASQSLSQAHTKSIKGTKTTSIKAQSTKNPQNPNTIKPEYNPEQAIHGKGVQQMLCLLIASTTTALVLYALASYIRRKATKPDYTSKTVWITGASSGIGQHMAYEFSRCGAYLVLSARNFEELCRVRDGCCDPARVEVVVLDMTRYQDIERVTKQVIASLQAGGRKLDVLVENAGQSMRCQFVDYAFENHLALFDVNVHGPYKHLQTVLPHMLKNKSGQIIAITSQSGKISTAFRSSYSGTKAAFIGILDSLRSELRPFGVRVCNIMPGCIRTNLAKNALCAEVGQKFGKTDSNIGRGMDPKKFAKEAVAAAYNDENEVSIAERWAPIAGIVMRNLCPDLVFRLLLQNAKTQFKAVLEAKSD